MPMHTLKLLIAAHVVDNSWSCKNQLANICIINYGFKRHTETADFV